MKRFKNILFVADSELKGGSALEHVVTLAENNQARLTVVSIIEEPPTDSIEEIQGISMIELQKSILEKQQFQLKAMVTSIGEKQIPIKTKVLTGVAFLVLIQEILRQKIDLLVKTAEEEGVIERLFGSSDMRLLRKCPCPVWLIKSSKQINHQKIMVAIDFDPFSHKLKNDLLNYQLLDMSIALALSDFSELHIVHVWHAYGEERMRSGFSWQPEAYVNAYVERIHVKNEYFFNELVAEVVNKAGNEIAQQLKLKTHLLKGFAKDKIPEIVKEQKIDLIMMGTVGRTGIPGFIMGNTAETILNRIDCSVLAVKPEGFVTPIKLAE
jgi:universal stress protein E